MDSIPYMSIDDDDFQNMIAYDTGLLDLIKDLRFTSHFSNIVDDLDEEGLRIFKQFESNYYDLEEFKQFLDKQNDNFSMIHFNTVNLADKHEKLTEILAPVADKIH